MYARRSFTLAVIGLALLAAGVYYLAPRIGPTSRSARYDEKVAAANTMKRAEETILDAQRERAEGSQISQDPIIAAMIGQPTSPITTDSGSLRAKVTSTNPNFAALMVDFLDEASVGHGDLVAVSYTGSFPALNIATIVAVEAMGAEPIIVSSVGASTWGANDPEFTFLDMESLLNSAGVIRHKSIAAAVGGDFRVRPLSSDARTLAQRAMQRNDVLFLNSTTLSDAITQRLGIYEDKSAGRPLKAFVNVGGGLVSSGGKANQREFDPGLTIGPATGDVESQGLIYNMEQQNIPVVNMTDVLTLAKDYRFAVNPKALPPIGEGTSWQNWTSLRIRAGIAAVILLIAVAVVRLFVLSPSAEKQAFDSYFGFLPARIKAFLRRFLGRSRQPSPAVPPVETSDAD